MKPYGQKKQAMVGKCKAHSADVCDICSNRGWKINKKRERKSDFEQQFDSLYESMERRQEASELQ